MGKQKSNGKVERVEEWPDAVVEEIKNIPVDSFKKAIIEDAVDNKKIAEKTVNIIFKHNRTFELTIGKKIFIFGPKECKEFPAKYLKHPDFLQQKDYFIIKEVK